MKHLTLLKITLYCIVALMVSTVLVQPVLARSKAISKTVKPRSIITSDGEIDDECSMVRFLLYANQWDIEGIVTSSSQYHWQGHNWAGDDWIEPYLNAGHYVRVYENTWLDPVPVEGYTHPEGRWYTKNAWGRQGTRERKTSAANPDYRAQ